MALFVPLVPVTGRATGPTVSHAARKGHRIRHRSDRCQAWTAAALELAAALTGTGLIAAKAAGTGGDEGRVLQIGQGPCADDLTLFGPDRRVGRLVDRDGVESQGPAFDRYHHIGIDRAGLDQGAPDPLRSCL